MLELSGQILYLLYVMKALRNKFITTQMLLAATLMTAVFLVGCATSGNSDTVTVPDMAGDIPRPSFGSVSFEHEMGPAGDVVRAFGNETGGGIVLMSGLEERALTPLKFRGATYEAAITEMAAAISCGYIHTDAYYMILPNEYQALQDIQIAEHLDDFYRDLSASIAFGAKTRLYNVFSVISESMGITLIADNVIAEARCGEIFLEKATLPAILEAVLQSSRITPNSFVVESTESYIFIHTMQNTGTKERLLNASAITAEQRSLLDKRIALTVPENNVSAMAFTVSPVVLREALPSLSRQLGIPVAAQRQLGEVPINPCRMREVRLETALNLLLRQWPLPNFGFEVHDAGILIRRK